MKISIIGAGNMAHQLGYALYKANHNIVEIYNRNSRKGSVLARKLDAGSIKKIDQLDADIDLIIIAVSDDAIGTISNQLDHKKLKDISIVHTSGSVSSIVLNDHVSHGVFYPFQTMTIGQELDFRQVPILVDANSDTGSDRLVQLAESISDIVHVVSDEQRGVIHVAGVFANNFSNHMVAVAGQILEKNALSLDILKPLISNTLHKILEMNPVDAQTGPAVRGDEEIIAKHLDFLSDQPDLKNLYQIVSDSIVSLDESNKL